VSGERRKPKPSGRTSRTPSPKTCSPAAISHLPGRIEVAVIKALMTAGAGLGQDFHGHAIGYSGLARRESRVGEAHYRVDFPGPRRNLEHQLRRCVGMQNRPAIKRAGLHAVGAAHRHGARLKRAQVEGRQVVGAQGLGERVHRCHGEQLDSRGGAVRAGEDFGRQVEVG
jgi:hypothetical protein